MEFKVRHDCHILKHKIWLRVTVSGVLLNNHTGDQCAPLTINRHKHIFTIYSPRVNVYHLLISITHMTAFDIADLAVYRTSDTFDPNKLPA